MLPRGFLGTKADVLMDLVVVGIVIAPILMLYAFRLARQKRFFAHRNLHAILIVLLISTIALFEVDIRLSGGSKIFLKNNSLVNNTFLRVFLIFHIIIAVSSFIGWINLEIKSWKSFSKALPGEFSSKHIRQGKIIFGGVVATAITGVSLYILGFAI
jgi:uncharacterized membrane protein YozB (DUF420 family)